MRSRLGSVPAAGLALTILLSIAVQAAVAGPRPCPPRPKAPRSSGAVGGGALEVGSGWLVTHLDPRPPGSLVLRAIADKKLNPCVTPTSMSTPTSKGANRAVSSANAYAVEGRLDTFEASLGTPAPSKDCRRRVRRALVDAAVLASTTMPEVRPSTAMVWWMAVPRASLVDAPLFPTALTPSAPVDGTWYRDSSQLLDWVSGCTAGVRTPRSARLGRVTGRLTVRVGPVLEHGRRGLTVVTAPPGLTEVRACMESRSLRGDSSAVDHEMLILAGTTLSSTAPERLGESVRKGLAIERAPRWVLPPGCVFPGGSRPAGGS